MKIEKQDDITIFIPEEDFTIFFLQEFKKKLYSMIEEGNKKFIFNFKNISWIDSMGISILLLAGKNAIKSGLKTYICNANEKVKYSITLMKIDQFICIKETQEDAIEEFKKAED